MIDRTACRYIQRLSKATLLAMFASKLDEDGQETMNPRKFLASMPDEDWTIISFSPATRVVCIDIRGEKTISVTMPVLSVSKLS